MESLIREAKKFFENQPINEETTKKPTKTTRGWCLTIFDMDIDLEKICEEHKIRYGIFGTEKCPTTGKMHLQSYIEFKNTKKFEQVKKIFGTAHIELRKGNRNQARDYCMKDGNYKEIGDWSAGGQGSRTDLIELMNDIKEGTPLLDIMESEPEYVSKHLRFIDRYTALIDREQTKKFRKVETEILWGDAGTGKTREVFEKDPDTFTVNVDETFPFDGYNGEKTILLDDFNGGIKYKTLLRILDGHQFRVNVKGSHRYARWTKIYITSNESPETWYNYGMTPELKRRITTIREFKI